MVRVISFDLVGTLFGHGFDYHLWHREIPRLYAKRHNVTLEEAKRHVFEEYRKFERKKMYTDVEFWFRHFDLHNWLTVMNDLKHLIKTYSDVVPTLERLGKEHRLVVVTQATRPIIELKFAASGLGKYFERSFSTPSDFSTFHKNGAVYKRVAAKLGVRPRDIVHIGDHMHYDYHFPRKAGVHAYFLNRAGHKVRGKYVVKDMNEFMEKLELHRSRRRSQGN